MHASCVLACSQAVFCAVTLHGIALRYSSYGALHLFYIRTFMIAYLHPTYVIHIYTIKCLHAAELVRDSKAATVQEMPPFAMLRKKGCNG